MRGCAGLVRAGLVVVVVSLGACTTAPPTPVDHPVSEPTSALKPFPDTSGFLQCVPFARTVSGVNIRGDAWTWWDQAAKKALQRGSAPREGAVLVFRQTPRLKLGHVAVVAQTGKNSREILVTHANWGSDGETRGVVHVRQPVKDVSAGNDWTLVRLRNRAGQWGSTYPAHGFIYQPTTTGPVASAVD